MKKFFAFLLSCILCISLFSVRPAEAATAKKTVLSRTTASVPVGRTLRLKLKHADGEVTWSSSKESVATVSAKGKITGKAVGSCKITAECNGKKYTCRVSVYKNIPIRIDSYTINGFSEVFRQVFAIDFKDSPEYSGFYKELQAYGNYGTFLFSYDENGEFDDDNFIVLIKNLSSAIKDNPESEVLPALAFAMIGTEEYTDQEGNSCRVFSGSTDMFDMEEFFDDAENSSLNEKKDNGVHFIYYPVSKGKDYDCLIIFSDSEVFDRISWYKNN
ncbi:MAG: Ig-like domain-containing protein [Lachnospiraceae bacterium]|nr:Ig-like domain-containing protein [Lachnospiraceae bacterium]